MPYKKYIIVCKHCDKEHLASGRNVKYCSIGCYNSDTKTKGIDGYKKCEVCEVKFPFRYSLKVRSYGKVKSTKSRFCSNKCKFYWRSVLENPMLQRSTRDKLSKKAKTRDHSHLWTKEAIMKRRNSTKGKTHWNWQGGITDENKKRRNSYETKQWRTKIFERDSYTCVLCGARNGGGKAVYLQADHIKPWCSFPDLRYDIDNGRTLCIECHRKTETYGVNAKKIVRTTALM